MPQKEKINLLVMIPEKVKFNPSFVYFRFWVLIEFAGTGTNWMKPRKSPDASAASKQKLEGSTKTFLCYLLVHDV